MTWEFGETREERVKTADVVSFINLLFGFASIIFVIKGDYLIASVLLILAVVSDFFDGRVARWLRQGNEMGKNIDSLSDIVSFGVAPAIFLSSLLDGFLVIIPFLIVLGGVYRLARYNVTKSDGYYRGMPITFTGIIIPILYFASVLDTLVIIVLSVILAYLMVSKIRVKKV